MALNKKKILLFTDWFVPGYKAGGPIRSCLHFAQQMKGKYDIYVMTTDRDLYAPAPYPNVMVNKWIVLEEGISVIYFSPGQLSWKNILQQIRSVCPDYIYLNSMYSRYFAVYPLLMRRLGVIRNKIILAPRGMLKQSAIQFGKTKKRLFLTGLRLAGIHRLIQWQATDDTEFKDIRKEFGHGARVFAASNFSGRIGNYPGSIAKKQNELLIIFVGRIHPIKNVDYLLGLLPQLPGNISLTLVGSEEDADYAKHCKELVRELPAGIRVQFMGERPNHRLPEIIHTHHILALPTQGENFGHAIFEALAAGKPVLISDQTPWRNLRQQKVGWDLPLHEKEAFIHALQQAAGFDQQQYDQWSMAAWQFAKDFSQQSDLKEVYYNIFS